MAAPLPQSPVALHAALALSVGLHVALAVALRVASPPLAAPSAPPPAPAPVEIDLAPDAEPVAVSAPEGREDLAQGEPGPTSEPGPRPEPEPGPEPGPQPGPEPGPQPEPEPGPGRRPESRPEPQPRPRREPEPSPPPPRDPRAGRDAPAIPKPAAKPSARPRAEAAARPAPPRPPRAPSSARALASTTPSAHAGGSGAPPGDGGGFARARARDLAASFTHAIPPACDAMEAWRTLPLGDGGSIIVDVTTDEEGRVTTDPTIVDDDPPRHLVEVVTRSRLRLGRAPTALDPRGAGPGTLRLRLAARIEAVPIPDDLPGGTFDLFSTFTSGRGEARFTLREGRRVTIAVEVVSVTRR